ncbi:MAG: arylsulfatase [Planctomycetota bacterium]
MNLRSSLSAGIGLLSALTPLSGVAAQDRERPNIVLILADDLGYGELGCYGQEKIRTPHIDRMAREGMRFTQAYSGAPVCAPARCVLMTGVSSPYAEVRGNREVKPEGQHPLSPEIETMPMALRAVGYATGAMGKWGLGPVGSTGDPNTKGFDLFFGYNCQREAHTYFPGHLWRNDERVSLNEPKVPGHQKVQEAPAEFATGGLETFRGDVYAPNLMREEALRFLDAQVGGDSPFFLYLPFVEPHLAMQPKPELVESYPAEWDEEPYLGTRGYLPHPRPRAGYAAMITDLDAHVGAVLDHLQTLGLDENTLVIFTSDNGPTHDVGGVDTTFFASAGPLRGRKGSVYEGGLRVPMIARWPGRIEAGSETDRLVAFQDLWPTFAQISGCRVAEGCDGLGFSEAMLGEESPDEHEWLAWEFFGYGGQKAVRIGRFKGVMKQIRKGRTEIELYDLDADLGETTDIASEHPEVVARIRAIMTDQRRPEPDFPLPAFDG